MKLEKLKVYTYKELMNKGIKVARLKANRSIKEKVVRKMKKSLLKYGQLTSATVIEAVRALKEGLEIVDFISGDPVSMENASEYIVLLDANHRFRSFLELMEDEPECNIDFYVMRPLNEDIEIVKLLAEINSCTFPWKGPDFIYGLHMSSKDNVPMLDYIYSLLGNDYSLPCATLWATLDHKISSQQASKALERGDTSCFSNDVNLDAGRAIQEAVSNALKDDKLCKTRVIPEWVISVRNASDDESIKAKERKLVNFFNSLSAEQVEELTSIKGTRGGETKESLVNNKLTEYYTAYCNHE